MTENKWYLDETELTIYDPESGNYNLETLADIKLIVGKLNYYEDFIEKFREHLATKESKINSLEDIIKHKIDALNMIKEAYEVKSKETDFNTQIIALIKLDCIQEIQKQYKLIELRDKGGELNE